MLKLHLAPMEGVVDWIVRDLLTAIGGIDQCVTEFIRVTDNLYPDHVFYDYCPELKTGGRTQAGVPVLVQLLGGQPIPLAENAARAAELGAPGIDLNFGCPAKTVNRHDGGATLLKYPDRIHRIVEKVREYVPAHIPVSAKIRLGFEDPTTCLENAQAVEAGGASTLAVHCRTKTDMYRPPAYWDWVPKIQEKVKIPVVANGEIWTVDDFRRCREITGCDEIMMGRGAIANPFLFREIRFAESAPQNRELLQFVYGFFDRGERELGPKYAQPRTKMWLAQISKRNPQVRTLFDHLKTVGEPGLFRSSLLNSIENSVSM